MTATPKSGFAQRAKEKLAARASAAAASALEPGEQILTGARVQSGVSQWWILLSNYARFFQKYYYLMLTDRRLVFCKLSFWTGRPSAVKIATPRDQVRVTDYAPGVVWATFRLSYPGRDKPMKLRAPRPWRPEIEFLVGALGAGPAAGQPIPGPKAMPGTLPDGSQIGGPAPG